MGEPVDTQAGNNVSSLEATMALHLRALTQERPYLADYEAEYRFHPTRQWRFDFAWPEMKVAVEVEGGQWTNGRHQRGQGYADDCEKYNNAILLGWKVFRFTGDMVKSGAARRFLESAFAPF
jgi:very-short-patch-repair endonuclease